MHFTFLYTSGENTATLLCLPQVSFPAYVNQLILSESNRATMISHQLSDPFLLLLKDLPHTLHGNFLI